MKLKAQGQNEAVIEKFCAQSCKTAKYAKSVVKKREASELKSGTNAQPTVDTASVSGSLQHVANNNGEAKFGEN